MKRPVVFFALALLLSVIRAAAQTPDDQYIQIYNTIQQADALNQQDRLPQALTKYREAQIALQRFKNGYPQWNPQVVNFRQNYLSSRIASLTEKVPDAAPPQPAVTPAPAVTTAPPRTIAPAATPMAPLSPAIAPPPPADLGSQLSAVQEQVRQLQMDKNSLESKLREALSVRPAAADPVALQQSESRAKQLEKENDLLKASLAQAKAKPVADPKTIAQMEQALAETNRQATRQAERADALARDKAALQAKLDGMKSAPVSSATLDEARKSLAQTKQKLAEETARADRLAKDKAALEKRVATLTPEGQAAAALRAENEILKKQLTSLQASNPTAKKAEENARALAKAQAQIAALQSDKEILRYENSTLLNRLKQANAQTASALASAERNSKSQPDARKLKEVERERDELRGRLTTANSQLAIANKQLSSTSKELAARTAERDSYERKLQEAERSRDELKKQLVAMNKDLKNKKGPDLSARVIELENQLATVQSRLEVVEAKRIPYTAEELAMLKAPEPALDANGVPRTTQKPLPAGTTVFAAEAQRHFAQKKFDQAEADYIKVVKQDNQNVTSLANLATIQLQMKKFDEADSNIRKALAIDPNDVFSLSLLGNLRFQQHRYDDALDVLGRAAKINGQDPQVQNLLGLAMSEKGMRGPAESAFRKAIQLQPTFGDAHKNLAFVYLTQDPPLVELAKWHYQKAIAAGAQASPDLEKMMEQKKSAE